MIFFIEEYYEAVVGWLLPDRPGSVPAVIVSLDGGRRRLRLEANWERPDLKAAGHHATGRCGIFINPETCEGYTQGCAIEIYDAETNVLMYRRFEQPYTKACIYHLETQIFPSYPIDRHLSTEIRMIYGNIELLGEQSRTHLTHSPFDSILISGQALYATMRGSLRSDFIRTTILSPPLRPIASALLLAKMLGATQEESATWRSLGMAELIEVVREIDLTDRKELTRALKQLSDEAYFTLANPTTRKLVAKLNEEKLGSQHLGAALDNLAEFDVIGFDDDLPRFRDELQERTGLSALPAVVEPEVPGLVAVMASLAESPMARELIDIDQAVYDIARGAAREALAEFEKSRLAEIEAARAEEEAAETEAEAAANRASAEG